MRRGVPAVPAACRDHFPTTRKDLSATPMIDAIVAHGIRRMTLFSYIRPIKSVPRKSPVLILGQGPAPEGDGLQVGSCCGSRPLGREQSPPWGCCHCHEPEECDVRRRYDRGDAARDGRSRRPGARGFWVGPTTVRDGVWWTSGFGTTGPGSPTLPRGRAGGVEGDHGRRNARSGWDPVATRFDSMYGSPQPRGSAEAGLVG